jgi:hypothetical protein
VHKTVRLLLFVLFSSLLSPLTFNSNIAVADSSPTTITICTSLKTGSTFISKSGNCNPRIYETRTWYKFGTAPLGTPGSKPIDLTTCQSKGSGALIIRSRIGCNQATQLTARWQRPLGPASAPSISSVVMGALGTATLKIEPSTDDGGSRITSYIVSSNPVTVTSVFTPAQIKAAKVTGLKPGTTYSFSAVAVNAQTPSPSSVTTTPTLAPNTPSAPTITSIVATGTNSAQLTFAAPTDNGGSPITSYVATAMPGGFQTTLSQSGSGTISISNLSHSSSYTFTLTANNAAGPSSASTISPAITTATPLPSPPPVAAAAAPAAPSDIVISTAAIAGVTAPVTGATPVTTTTAGTGYTGTVTWSGSPSTFSSVTTYTATITLTPTSGYTLTGVTANFFTVAGATTVTHSANSGVITAAFPATAVGPAAKVAITRASVGTQRRTAFTTQPQITVQDSGGNTITSSSDVVTATITSGAGGSFVGTDTATAASGVATFTGLGVDGTPGTTYTITYTVTGLTVATATVTLTGTTCNGSFTCQVGDTGPGGGTIFYVALTSFTLDSATGSMCTTNCKYLEAAPTSGTNAWTAANLYYWDTTTAIVAARVARIGSGYANTLAIVGPNTSSGKAGAASLGYRGPNSLTDWFLPSEDELNQMCKWQRGQAWTSDATLCNNPSATLNTGAGATGYGFTTSAYWSSTDSSDATKARGQSFSNGSQNSYVKLTAQFRVMPIRAFGSP